MKLSTERIATILEVGRTPGGEIPESLISAAYQASRDTPIMLVLDSVSPKEVNRILDPVVAKVGSRLRGLIYANSNDSAVLTVAASARRVFAASEDFRAKLTALGIPFENASDAEPIFAQASL